MTTVVLGERPQELDAWLERRRELGQDGFDEVWEGEYHGAPVAHGRHGLVDDQLAQVLGPRARQAGLRGSGPLNLGVSHDYRVPDRAYLSGLECFLYNPTAAIVVEIVSPGDESRRKFDFYFSAGVEEILIVDPKLRSVEWYRRGAHAFEAAPASVLLGVSGDELVAELEWPA